jgi:hypothetical protein
MRKLSLLFLMAFVAMVCASAITAAATPAPASTVQLTADPFLNADITTRVPMVPRCPCTPIFTSCAFHPLGENCVQEPNCCSCRGPEPALYKCVGVPPSL